MNARAIQLVGRARGLIALYPGGALELVMCSALVLGRGRVPACGELALAIVDRPAVQCVMSEDASLSGLVEEIEHSLEDLKRPPRTFADKLLASGADFILAIAFFALGLTANVIAPYVSNIGALASAFVGLIVLKAWGIAREYESTRGEMKELARDAKLAAMIVELTVNTLAKRQHDSGGPNGGSDSCERAGASVDSEASPKVAI